MDLREPELSLVPLGPVSPLGLQGANNLDWALPGAHHIALRGLALLEMSKGEPLMLMEGSEFGKDE